MLLDIDEERFRLLKSQGVLQGVDIADRGRENRPKFLGRIGPGALFDQVKVYVVQPILQVVCTARTSVSHQRSEVPEGAIEIPAVGTEQLARQPPPERTQGTARTACIVGGIQRKGAFEHCSGLGENTCPHRGQVVEFDGSQPVEARPVKRFSIRGDSDGLIRSHAAIDEQGNIVAIKNKVKPLETADLWKVWKES